MKMRYAKNGLALLLSGAMLFGMAACGNKDEDGNGGGSSQTASSAPGADFNEREGYYVENIYEMPANTYAVVAPYMRPDGVVEFLGQINDPSSMTATVSVDANAADTEEGADVTASPDGASKSAAAEGEAPPTAEAPQVEYTLFTWNVDSKAWEETEAPWLEEIKPQISNINAMTTLADGTRYLIAGEAMDDEARQDDITGYTPPKLMLFVIAADGGISTKDVDWHVANMDYSGMQDGTEPEITVTKATFERVEYPEGMYDASEMSVTDGQDGQESAGVEGADTAADEATEGAAEDTSDTIVPPAELPEPVGGTAAAEDQEVGTEISASSTADVETDEANDEDSDEEGGVMYGGINQTAPSPQQITVLDNGNMLIADYAATLIYGADGSYIDIVGNSSSGSYGMGTQSALDGNYMYTIGSNGIGRDYTVSVDQYDLSSSNYKDPVASFPAPPNSRNYYYMAQITVDKGILYWMDQTGIYSYDMAAGDAGEWTEIAGPELLYITDPDASLQGLQADGQGSFYTLLSNYGGGMTTSSFLAITYTTDAPIEVTAELNIYTLSDDYSVRREVSKFRKKNPGVLVNIQTGMDYESNTTKQDVINALNKLLLAEKGPDILILDGLPIDSYIEKGVMMDLSEWMAPKLSQGTWMEGLAKAYQREDGGIYALPTRMTVPILLGKQSDLDSFKSLTDFADYVAANDDIPAVYDTTPFGLLRTCYIMASDTILKEDGSIDEAGLAQFLTDVKKIADTDKGAALSQEMYDLYKQYSMDVEAEYDFSSSMGGNGTLPYAFGDCSFGFEDIYGTDSWMLIQAANKKRGAGSDDMSLLPANGRHLFEPRNIIGINARTEYKEECLALLDSITAPADAGDSNRYFYGIPLVTENMMPVERTPEEIAAMGGVESSSSFGYGDQKGRTLIVSGEAKRADAEALIEFLKPLDTPVVIDSQIVKAIYDNSKPFFEGTETAEQTVTKIVDATRIYMSE